MKDRLGQTLVVGDYVIYHDYNGLKLAQVKKITSKRVKCQDLKVENYHGEYVGYKHPDSLAKYDELAVMTWILKGSKYHKPVDA